MVNIFKFIFSFFLISTLHTSETVLIITHAYNRPEFLDLQCRSFKKFLLDDYEFVVFNDAPPGPMHDSINSVCSKWNTKCIPIPQDIHNHQFDDEFWQNDVGSEGTRRHVDCIQYSLDILGYDHNGAVALFDSDLFLIKQFSILESLKNSDIVAITKNPIYGGCEITHLWPGLTFLAMDRLPNKKTLDFKCGRINGKLVDTGGHTYFYLTENKNVRLTSIGNFLDGSVAKFHRLKLKNRIKKYSLNGFENREISWLLKYPRIDVEFYHFNHFMHHGAGRLSNDTKSSAVLEYINEILGDT